MTGGEPRVGTAGHEQPWAELLTEDDRARLAKTRFGRRVGFGRIPALLLVDVQNYMVGPPNLGDDTGYPFACGDTAREAVSRLAPLVAAARSAAVPVFYARHELRRDDRDLGVSRLRRDLLNLDGWCIEGTTGAEFVPSVAPLPDDRVVVKKKWSAFFGTPLLSALVDLGIDTVVVAGGATSSSVRATVVDSTSFNFRTLLVSDCVFDRFRVSHLTALFDMDRQYADVVPRDDVLTHFARLEASP
jgi:maleamate amidohydrolase